MKRSRMAFPEIFIIPEEVLVSEIFMRLPANCILTLRSVCRSWRRLTTEPSFVRAHVHRARHADADASFAEPIVYQLNGRTTKDGELHSLKLDAHDVDNNTVSTFKIRAIPGSVPVLRLVASCDGLLCFQPYDYSFEGEDLNEDLQKPCYVCNPVTRIWTTVEGTAGAAVPQEYRYRYLLGFYFHRSTGEYRLLHYRANYVADREREWLEGAYEVATVGGENKLWRSIRDFRLSEDRAYDAAQNYDAAEVLALYGVTDHHIAVNGRLHWLHSITSCRMGRMGVVVFDTQSEKFSRISAPICPHKVHPNEFRMNKIRGNLCLGWITKNRYGEETMELWMLKDRAKQQWAKLHTIRPDRRGFVRTVRPREGVRDDEEGDGEMMVRWDAYRFGIYNFKLKTYKQITITSSDLQDIMTDAYSNHNVILFYRESLVDPRTNLL